MCPEAARKATNRLTTGPFSVSSECGVWGSAGVHMWLLWGGKRDDRDAERNELAAELGLSSGFCAGLRVEGAQITCHSATEVHVRVHLELSSCRRHDKFN